MLFSQPQPIDSRGTPWLSTMTKPAHKPVPRRYSPAPTVDQRRGGLLEMPRPAHETTVQPQPSEAARRRPAHAAALQREPRNVLIIGTDPVARDVRDYFTALPELGYNVRGFVRADGAPPPEELQSETLGSIDEILSIARSRFVEDLLFSSTPHPEDLDALLLQARTHDINVRYIPTVSETLRLSHEVEYIGDLPTIVLYRKVRRRLPLLIKRSMDALSAMLGLLLISPVLAAVAIAIKLSSPGPVLYASERVGRKGRLFTCYKFRTMVPNAEALRSRLLHLNEREGVLFKMAKDPRVTPLGRVLRKYSLDELPQLWNVLRGDMSLVGPRPCIQSELAQYQTAHFRRLDVVPGMTGLWQVEARHDPSFESYIQLDSRYVSDWSILLDLKILLRTLRVVVLGTGV